MPSFSRILLMLLSLSLLLCGCQTTPAKPEATVSSVEFAMDTWIEQRWRGEEAQETCDEILARIQDIEARLSLYREDSELAALNAAAGKHPVAVSDDTFELLSRAKELSAESGGIFDVTIAPLTLVWGITHGEPHIPSEKDIAEARALVDYRDLILDKSAQTVMLAREGMKLDLGGIAKGMAASAVSEIPQRHGSEGYLSIGGNMMVRGHGTDGGEILVGIRDPRGEVNDPIGSVTLDGQTMATTGDYERYFELDGVRYHHVLNPFTGYPSTTDLISVTVITADGTLADCLSTTIFLKGSEALGDYLTRDDCLVMAITNDRRVYASPGLWERFTANPAKTEYTFYS